MTYFLYNLYYKIEDLLVFCKKKKNWIDFDKHRYTISKVSNL